MAKRKRSESDHVVAVIRTQNGELVEDVVHSQAVEQEAETPHGTVIESSPMPEADGRAHPTDPKPGTLPRP